MDEIRCMKLLLLVCVVPLPLILIDLYFFQVFDVEERLFWPLQGK